MGNIIGNTVADSRYVPALQLADLFAYAACNPEREAEYRWMVTLGKINRFSQLLDYAVLIDPIPAIARLHKSWKLPKRTPHQ